MVQVVSCHPLTAEAWVQSHVSSCDTYGGHSGAKTIFLQVPQFSPVTIIPPMLHTHSLTVTDAI
jgi:hypothetical protein